jgi:Flp pilus assembly protein protease CpaA
MLSSPLLVHPWPLLQWGAVLAAAALAALTDLRSRRIPNALTLPLLAAGLLVAWGAAGAGGLVDALLGCAVAGLPYVLLFLYAGGGAGDAKLMGALGAWLGLTQGLLLLLCVNVAAVVFAIAYARGHGRLRESFERFAGVFWSTTASVLGGGGFSSTMSSVTTPVEGSLKMPYGVAIFLGALLASGSVLL